MDLGLAQMLRRSHPTVCVSGGQRLRIAGQVHMVNFIIGSKRLAISFQSVRSMLCWAVYRYQICPPCPDRFSPNADALTGRYGVAVSIAAEFVRQFLRFDFLVAEYGAAHRTEAQKISRKDESGVRGY